MWMRVSDAATYFSLCCRHFDLHSFQVAPKFLDAASSGSSESLERVVAPELTSPFAAFAPVQCDPLAGTCPEDAPCAHALLCGWFRGMYFFEIF